MNRLPRGQAGNHRQDRCSSCCAYAGVNR